MQTVLDFESRAPDTRVGDYWTCQAAASNVKKHTTEGRRLVLKALLLRPMNDFELASASGWQQTSIGKRRLECQRAGLVEACAGLDGKQAARPAPSGTMSLVWQITDVGRALMLDAGRGK